MDEFRLAHRCGEMRVLPQEHGAGEVHSAGRLLVEVGLVVARTADPSTSLGMTKGGVALSLRLIAG